MRNIDLAVDYIKRCGARLAALKTLHEQKSWPDVVRESQEVVELALKALLRKKGIDFPRIHDVSGILEEKAELLPQEVQRDLDKLCQISRSARRDREIAFYGAEDLSPLEFYSEEDAKKAMDDAKYVVRVVKKVVLP
ncbi:HEPN domain-containing protein [bacterium]|nr:HEPN domain-containing protein [bacterium]NBX82086.1 HEPN domain-containing protein [bacterium]